MIIDDQEVYSTGLVSAMLPVFKKAGIQVDHESVSQKVDRLLVDRLKGRSPDDGGRAAVAGRRQRRSSSARTSPSRRRRRRSSGPTGRSPRRSRSRARTCRRSAPTSTRSRPTPRSRRPPRPLTRSTGRSVLRCSPPTHVIDEAIASVCKSGQTPSRANVLAAVKGTSEASSILGQPIKFDNHGDLIGSQVVPVQDQRQGSVQAGHQLRDQLIDGR